MRILFGPGQSWGHRVPAGGSQEAPRVSGDDCNYHDMLTQDFCLAYMHTVSLLSAAVLSALLWSDSEVWSPRRSWSLRNARHRCLGTRPVVEVVLLDGAMAWSPGDLL